MTSLHQLLSLGILTLGAAASARGQSAITRYVFNSGCGTITSATLSISTTSGEAVCGSASGPTTTIGSGFWGGAGAFCYANCDGSINPPILNVNDFQCFVNRFAASDPYANCDGSTAPPILNVNDFQCFINAFSAGCT